ncbi:MAG: ProQ/FINO family protein [Aquabacterium sp.]
MSSSYPAVPTPADPSPSVTPEGRAPESAVVDTAPTPDAASAPAEAPKASTPAVSPAETGARLAALFPALFAGQPKPLKLRIHADIQARAPGEFSKQALSAFLRRHTGATSYLIAVSKATHRFDLDGQPAGELSDEHRQMAADELKRRRQLRDARRDEELKGRRERAALLRDFERTTLTEANFCALKGMSPDQLAATLAQAREEAKEDAARPAPHRDRRHGRPDRPGRPGQPGARDDRPRGDRPQGDRPQGARGPGRGGDRGRPGPRKA